VGGRRALHVPPKIFFFNLVKKMQCWEKLVMLLVLLQKLILIEKAANALSC
jgi:hypothetical protein